MAAPGKRSCGSPPASSSAASSFTLPTGFHRIRHYGLLASGVRADNIARVRALLAAATPRDQDKRATEGDEAELRALDHPCPCCGGRMIIIERFKSGRAPPRSSVGQIRIDTS